MNFGNIWLESCLKKAISQPILVQNDQILGKKVKKMLIFEYFSLFEYFSAFDQKMAIFGDGYGRNTRNYTFLPNTKNI